MWFYHIYFIKFLQFHLIYSSFVTSTECSSGSALTGKLSSVLVNSYGWVFNSYVQLVLIIKREIRTHNNEPKLIFSQRNRSCYFHSQQHRSQLQILNNIVKKCQFTSWWRWCPIKIWSMPFHFSEELSLPKPSPLNVAASSGPSTIPFLQHVVLRSMVYTIELRLFFFDSLN